MTKKQMMQAIIDEYFSACDIWWSNTKLAKDDYLSENMRAICKRDASESMESAHAIERILIKIEPNTDWFDEWCIYSYNKEHEITC